LSHEDRVEEALFTGLRLVRGIDLKLIESRYGVGVWRRWGHELQPFLDEGLLVHENGGLHLTRAGMLLAHEIMAVFISSTVR